MTIDLCESGTYTTANLADHPDRSDHRWTVDTVDDLILVVGALTHFRTRLRSFLPRSWQWWRRGLTCSKRNDLKAQGIGSNVHYIPVPLHRFYRNMGYTMQHLPKALAYYDNALPLSLFYARKDDEYGSVKESTQRLVG